MHVFLFADIETEYKRILEEHPFWGFGKPREWFSFVAFGKAVKVTNPAAEAHVWTCKSASRCSRNSAVRKGQRIRSESFRQRLRDEADARLVFLLVLQVYVYIFVCYMCIMYICYMFCK